MLPTPKRSYTSEDASKISQKYCIIFGHPKSTETHIFRGCIFYTHFKEREDDIMATAKNFHPETTGVGYTLEKKTEKMFTNPLLLLPKKKQNLMQIHF